MKISVERKAERGRKDKRQSTFAKATADKESHKTKVKKHRAQGRKRLRNAKRKTLNGLIQNAKISYEIETSNYKIGGGKQQIAGVVYKTKEDNYKTTGGNYRIAGGFHKTGGGN